MSKIIRLMKKIIKLSKLKKSKEGGIMGIVEQEIDISDNNDIEYIVEW